MLTQHNALNIHQQSFQVLGADEPIHERSQLSFPVIYHTQPVPLPHNTQQLVLRAPQPHNQPQQQLRIENKATTAKQPQGKILAITDGSTIGTTIAANAVTTGNGNGGGVNAHKGMSKTKKEIISAMISGQQMIQIEKLNSAYQSHGVSETYL